MKLSGNVKRTADEEVEVLAVLKAMESDDVYNTASRYSSNAALYPDNIMTFSAQHIAYLRKFPNIDSHQYVQNLRLITRVS